jgi:hypothetical protein
MCLSVVRTIGTVEVGTGRGNGIEARQVGVMEDTDIWRVAKKMLRQHADAASYQVVQFAGEPLKDRNTKEYDALGQHCLGYQEAGSVEAVVINELTSPSSSISDRLCHDPHDCLPTRQPLRSCRNPLWSFRNNGRLGSDRL